MVTNLVCLSRLTWIPSIVFGWRVSITSAKAKSGTVTPPLLPPKTKTPPTRLRIDASFFASEGKITPWERRRLSTAAVHADTLKADSQCVWSHLWQRYNMMQTRRRGIQVRLKAPFRDFTLYSNFSQSYQISLIFPSLSLTHWLLVMCCMIIECFSSPLCVLVERPVAVVLAGSFSSFHFLNSLFPSVIHCNCVPIFFCMHQFFSAWH